MDDERLARERQFHDVAYADKRRIQVSRAYSLLTRCHAYYRDRVTAIARSASILEFGCGTGSLAPELAGYGRVSGIDISPVAIRLATQEAEASGRAIQYVVGNAEHTPFDDGMFDLVCGSAILHHLDLHAAYDEIRRLLRPGGSAIFMEPLGHNPIIGAFRRRTPSLRTVDEHPLLMGDLRLARDYFSSVKLTYFALLTLPMVPIAHLRLAQPILRATQSIDELVLRGIPPLRRFAWYCVIEAKTSRA